MRRIEIHVLQSLPDSRVNRDDLGRPKTSLYGGYNRLRVSSQAWKRAVRERLREAGHPLLWRTRALPDLLAAELKGHPRPHDLAQLVTSGLFAAKQEAEEEGLSGSTNALIHVTPGEVTALAEVVRRHQDVLDRVLEEETRRREAERTRLLKKVQELEKKHGERPEQPEARRELARARRELEAIERWSYRLELPKAVEKELRAAFTRPQMTVDLALFGRLLAELPEAKRVEGAFQLAPAISVDEVRPEVDYFTAVDDLNEGGAGMIGESEYASGVLYRYGVLELARLGQHLGPERVPAVAAAAVEAMVRAFPHGGRAWAPYSVPHFVAVAVGQPTPLNLMRAFELPVRPEPDRSVGEVAVERLLRHWQQSQRVTGKPQAVLTLDLTGQAESEADLEALLARLVGLLEAAYPARAQEA